MQDERLRTLGKRIRRIREGKGLTQATLAAKVKTGRTHLNEVENGQHDLGFKLLVNLAATLEVSLDDLFPQSYIVAASQKETLPGMTKEQLLHVVNEAKLTHISKEQHYRIKETLCWFLPFWWWNHKGRTMRIHDITNICITECPYLKTRALAASPNNIRGSLGSALTSLSEAPLGELEISKGKADRHVVYTLEKSSLEGRRGDD